MTRHLVVFIVTFAVGAVIAVVLRTGSHKPYQDAGHPALGVAAPAPASASATPAGHAGHGGVAMAPASATAALASATAAPASATAAATTVNTVCSICGMKSDASLGTIEYKGKQVGFGCKACPPKFKAEPEKYGEAALKNQVVE
jgi:YHS domain-containing protein